MTLSLAILLSGRGSNMQAIHRSILEGRLDAKINLILSNKADAAGLEYAKSKNIPTALVERKPGEDRVAYDKRMIDIIDEQQIDIIVLAGFMRLLSEEFVQHYPNKIVNIHPALLPSFPGLNSQKQALDAGVRFAGCTVHFVDEGCDTGPIIDQRVVPILPDDDEETLSARILKQEHQLYSACLQKIAEGKVQVEGRRVILRE